MGGGLGGETPLEDYQKYEVGTAGGLLHPILSCGVLIWRVGVNKVVEATLTQRINKGSGRAICD